jgi:hypothetical protein
MAELALNFVHHDPVRLRQLVGDDASIAVVLESLQAHRVEDLFWRREFGEEALEVASTKSLCDSARERALTRARRAEQEDVIAAKQGVESSLDQLAALRELGGEILSELLKLLNGCAHRVSLVFGRQARRS